MAQCGRMVQACLLLTQPSLRLFRSQNLSTTCEIIQAEVEQGVLGTHLPSKPKGRSCVVRQRHVECSGVAISTSCSRASCSATQPFLGNRQGWRVFLRIDRIVSGPLQRFQGTVVIESGQARSDFVGLVNEVQCPRHHATCADATCDAVDLAQVVLAFIDAASTTEIPVSRHALSALSRDTR